MPLRSVLYGTHEGYEHFLRVLLTLKDQVRDIKCDSVKRVNSHVFVDQSYPDSGIFNKNHLFIT